MNWVQRLFTLALLALALAGLRLPSFAQTPNPETENEEDIVCIPVLYVFNGSLEQTKAIQSKPVPDGFFRDHPPRSCSSGPLPRDLITWHLLFGTETSALAAADAIAARSLAGAPRSGIREDLGKWWQAALRDYNRARQNLARDPADKQLKASLRRAESPLYEVTGVADRYGNVAGHYLEIADAFASRRALSEAERIFAMESQALTFLAEDVFKNPHPYLRENFPGLVADEVWRRPVPRIPLRAAVLRARLLDTPEAIDAALDQLKQNYTPALQEAWRLIHERLDDDICNIPDRLPVLTAACDVTPDFLNNTVPAFLHAAVQLELVMAAHPGLYPQQRAYYDPADPRSRPGPFNVHEVLRWLEAKWSDEWDRRVSGWSELTKHQFITLLLMQADLAASNQTHRGAQGDYESVATMLRSLERRVPPAEAPTLFRRIAERYLANHQAELASASPSQTQDRARTAAYFRHTLENLNAIAVGK